MEDLDPTPVEFRSWGWRTFAMTWIGMVINPASLAEGAALLSIGLTMGEAAVAHLLGGMILVVVLALNAWPGVKYGIPFPVLARSSFGYVGSQFATLTRGAVAIMWLSFQLWQGALGLFAAGGRVFGEGFTEWGRIDEYLTLGQLLLLLAFISLHVLAVRLGAARFRSLVYAIAPMQLLGCIAIAVWAASLCSFGDAMRADDHVAAEARTSGGALPRPQAWLAAINSSVGTWSTLVLNVADLSRFAPSQRDQIVGQAIGLPLPFGLTGLLGLWVAGASSFAFGEALWQIPQYFERWPPAAALAGAVVLACSILVVNVIANLLSPMNDLLNAAPPLQDVRLRVSRPRARRVPVADLLVAAALRPLLPQRLLPHHRRHRRRTPHRLLADPRRAPRRGRAVPRAAAPAAALVRPLLPRHAHRQLARLCRRRRRRRAVRARLRRVAARRLDLDRDRAAAARPRPRVLGVVVRLSRRLLRHLLAAQRRHRRAARRPQAAALLRAAAR
tara:strand:+ start:953 stop:2458 length:1506 start_codon:yes stop_codon:yes gene_type:complete